MKQTQAELVVPLRRLHCGCIDDRAHAIAVRDWKSPGIELDILDQARVEQADGAVEVFLNKTVHTGAGRSG
jgi:hypothetical protein